MIAILLTILTILITLSICYCVGKYTCDLYEGAPIWELTMLGAGKIMLFISIIGVIIIAFCGLYSFFNTFSL